MFHLTGTVSSFNGVLYLWICSGKYTHSEFLLSYHSKALISLKRKGQKVLNSSAWSLISSRNQPSQSLSLTPAPWHRDLNSLPPQLSPNFTEFSRIRKFDLVKLGNGGGGVGHCSLSSLAEWRGHQFSRLWWSPWKEGSFAVCFDLTASFHTNSAGEKHSLKRS